MRVAIALGLSFFLFFTACTKKEEAPPVEAEVQKAPAAVAGPPADVSGRATYSGKAKRKLVKMSADAVCVKAHKGQKVYDEPVVVNAKGELKNVFVYVKGSVSGQYSTPAPVTLDQNGCLYTPRIWGLQTNQIIKIKNSDPTLHNVHSLAKKNKNFNSGMPKKGQIIEKTFSKPETMIRIKCDVHGWMTTYVGVLNHPFYAVTSANGTYSFPPLPPGTYTIAAWHEKLGTKTQDVTLAPGQKAQVNFKF